MTMVQEKGDQAAGPSRRERRRVSDLECRSLLAEQARQLAHRIRTPLSVVDLISETLQLELQEDSDKVERISQVLKASAKVSAALTETVRAAVFPETAPQAIDPVGLAARLVLQQGGRIDQSAAQARCRVHSAPDAFEAAVMHGLRLLSDGTRQPVLAASLQAGHLCLRLSTDATGADNSAFERIDRDLMLRAIDRVARDAGGSLRHEPGLIELLLPVMVREDVGRPRHAPP